MSNDLSERTQRRASAVAVVGMAGYLVSMQQGSGLGIVMSGLVAIVAGFVALIEADPEGSEVDHK